MKYRLLTVQFTYNNCVFTKMIAIPHGENSPMTKGLIINSISIVEQIDEEAIADLIIFNSIDLSYEEYLTF